MRLSDITQEVYSTLYKGAVTMGHKYEIHWLYHSGPSRNCQPDGIEEQHLNVAAGGIRKIITWYYGTPPQRLWHIL